MTAKLAKLAASMIIAAVVASGSVRAEAYCRTTVCGPEGDASAGMRCVPAMAADCGIPLQWRTNCLGFSVQEDGSSRVSAAVTEDLMGQAFDAWLNASCAGGGVPDLAVSNLGQVECDAQEYNSEGGNANIIIFRDDTWPYDGANSTLALTTVTYAIDDGEIFDTDLEINTTSQNAITVGDGPDIQFDLLSILTHEAGHMLGIAHSADSTSTMRLSYVPGHLELRDLAPDDVAAICAAYPPGTTSESCDPEPRHGFKETCGPDEDCSCRTVGVTRASGASRHLTIWGLALAGALAGARRRKRRGQTHD